MNEKEILKNNELLTNYMGYIEKNYKLFVEDSDEINQILKHKFFLNDAKFHYSWDWIMAVVEKINEEPNVDVVSIAAGLGADIDFKGLSFGNIPNCCNKIMDENTLIECVYKTCVEFIEWKNNNK